MTLASATEPWRCPARTYIRCDTIWIARIDFDWDDENRTHLAAHKVDTVEFGRC